MATKKTTPTANQRESRVSTPTTKSAGALPKGGGAAASGSKLVQPKSGGTGGTLVAQAITIYQKPIKIILQKLHELIR